MSKLHLIQRDYWLNVLYEFLNMFDSFYNFEDEFIVNHLKELLAYLEDKICKAPDNCDYVESYVVEVFKEVD